MKIWTKSDNPFKSYDFPKFWLTLLMGSLNWQCTGTKWLPTWRTLHSFCTQNFTFSSFSRKVDKILFFQLNIIYPKQFCKHSRKNGVDFSFEIWYWSIFDQFMYKVNEEFSMYDITDYANWLEVANLRMPITGGNDNFENS